MGCNCNKRRAERTAKRAAQTPEERAAFYSVMGNYKYLNKSQINKRLNVYKNINCKGCLTKNTCTFENYTGCETKGV